MYTFGICDAVVASNGERVGGMEPAFFTLTFSYASGMVRIRPQGRPLQFGGDYLGGLFCFSPYSAMPSEDILPARLSHRPISVRQSGEHILEGVGTMGEFFKLILPILLQILPQLFNKSKAKFVEWLETGKDAALASRDPWSAFLMGSATCAINGMDDDEYEDIKLAIQNSSLASREMTREMAARRNAKDSEKGGAK